MCGGGTFLFEACMIAKNIPPNLNRKTLLLKNGTTGIKTYS